MDYKAKYEEALERAKEIKSKILSSHLSTESCKAVSEYIDTIIPELRESEDEKIRKGIVETIKQCPDTFLNPKNRDEMLAYLEKQKELDKMIVVSPEVWDNAISDAFENGKKEGEKQKEQKLLKVGENAYFDPNTDMWFIKEGQKPISKEDMPYITDEHFWEREPADSFKYKLAEYMTKCCTKKEGPYGYTYGISAESILKMAEEELLKRGVVQKPVEWSADWREEDIQTRFAFYTYKDDSSVLYLSNVFVEEASRNHGFGTRILRAAEKVAETIGATTISLKVKQDSPANTWYRKRGYGYVAFEDGYDWLEKNLEYMKPNYNTLPIEQQMEAAMIAIRGEMPSKSQDWSEEDEQMAHAILNLLCSQVTYVTGQGTTSGKQFPTYAKERDWFEKRFKSLRPQPQGTYEQVIHTIFGMLKDKDFYEIQPSHRVSLLNDIRVKCKDAIECAPILDEPHWKPTEEDEKCLQEMMQHIEHCVTVYGASEPKWQQWLNLLNSLRNRAIWKPSDWFRC